MKRYKIANLIVDIDATCERLAKQAVKYECDEVGEADITVILTEQRLDELQENYPYLSRDDVAYLATGSIFHRKLTKFDGLFLHSSCIEMDGRAYCFSADSGTGKSTHTSIWKKVFGDRVTYINDDKPAVRKIDGKYYAFGTPWSGKTALNNNIYAPLCAIVFIERAETNSIEPMDPIKDQIALRFLEQTARPKNFDFMDSMLKTADDLLSKTPVLRLRCNMSDDAAITSYEYLKNC